MIYNYNPANLIATSDLIRAVRQQVTQLFPVAPLDREQLLQAIAMACTDLDVADPLISEHTIDVSPYAGQDAYAPCIPSAVPINRTNIVTLYHPGAIDQDNQITWEWCGPADLRPQCVITANTLLALVHWPYAAAALSEINHTAPPPANKTPCRAYSSNTLIPLVYTFSMPVVDGIQIRAGDRVLIGNDAISANAGIFILNHTNENEYTLQRPADADTPAEITGSIVAVLEGTHYAGSIYQIYLDVEFTDWYTVRPAPVGSYTIQRSNITNDQASAYIVPRAAAYCVHALALTTADKTVAKNMIDWAVTLLARPLPVQPQAITYRIKAATQYADS